ncbi:MAG: FkbM family methyltransferase [Xanthomonadaceae bacterium]|nr:FkbM family methyltransferase [Xanthomonadaceae bacterium]
MGQSRKFREFIKVLFAPILVTIRSGPLQGCRWSLTTGKNFLTGKYEPEKTAMLAAEVRPGDIVFDIGAHVGYFTVLMSQAVGADGRVYAFEPRPLNLRFLRRHVAVNGCGNVEIFDTSVGNRPGTARLETRTGTGTGHISESGNIEVDMVSVDALVDSGRLPAPTFIKVDVEGGEMMVLRGALRVLERHRPRMMLATHGAAIDRQCREFLTPLGYTMTDIGQVEGDVEYLVLPQ